ncbi:hypothetical protein B0I35DRAFT_198781 [Stachybotrys elegans]|uniref:Uncharacterized protein n=1 Tax=Stachybotrys elegans TaxID=80388 RepID=A0A8K0WRX7_9HYPO|nr:hypothetical protein B0I35DRAFT_198781 [Stachybotrys elegans]
MPSEAVVLDPAAVTVAPDHEPFVLVPVIRDILRTGHCPSGSVFLVEGVDLFPISRNGRWQISRLLLGDGELCVQALLAASLQRFVEAGEVFVGCYVRIESLQLKWEKATPDDGEDNSRQDMVYAVVNDLVTIGWNDSYREMWQAQHVTQQLVLEDTRRPDTRRKQVTFEQDIVQTPAEPSVRQAQRKTKPQEPEDGDDAFEDFEAFTVPPKRPQSASRPVSNAKAAASSSLSSSKRHIDQPIALPKDWHDPHVPLKLTTLHSIPYLPYRQNWSVNVLAIIAELYPVEPSPFPPYKQRKARITDPSTAKRVSLSIFLDPEGFQPAVGSSVLLVGVKNHPYDGGSLKKYASDAQYGKWWFQDPFELGWCDVDGIKRWWAEMQMSTEG